MSDDLISRKAIYKAISDYLNRSRLGETSAQTDLRVGEIASIIHGVPTAFNKEKVIEELKSNMGSAQLAQLLTGTDLVQCGGFSYGYYNGVKDAVKIVEKGGIE